MLLVFANTLWLSIERCTRPVLEAPPLLLHELIVVWILWIELPRAAFALAMRAFGRLEKGTILAEIVSD